MNALKCFHVRAKAETDKPMSDIHGHNSLF